MKKSVLLFIVFLIFLNLIPAAGMNTSESESAHTSSVKSGDNNHVNKESDHSNITADKHESGSHDDLGKILPLWSVIPFVGILLSIALFPLLASRFWHHNFGKVSAFWAAVITVPMLIAYGGDALHGFLHIIIADYVPFIILLWGLFTVSGGIYLSGSLRGTPKVNTIMILIGTLLSSWMGTTGAAMLMIRPFLRANNYRKNRTFMVVFFIFLVANIGGSLTPIGDPPLFLGFLHGVPFFWTFNILPHMVLAVVLLLIIYYFVDSHFFKKEIAAPPEDENKIPFKLDGRINFLFLAFLVGSVIVSGIVDWGDTNIFGIHRPVQEWARDGFIIVMGLFSLKFTSKKIRDDNDFTWFPIKEVAYLFSGIFLTMTPCLLLLKAGSEGALAFIIEAVKEPHHYFWVTGLLSSFLDNAPTYLTFFSTSLGKFYAGMEEAQAVSLLIKENAIFLKAISTGAVFFGANTYIGNAPNFMVRSIAEESGTPMPSFFGYMLRYSIPVLIPIFVIITLLFFSS
ncbi:MAG: sodium:proton antiporter [Spirochaetes bacterium]|nr:sodium:proton antiporter [Spirochaetota bacterium]